MPSLAQQLGQIHNVPALINIATLAVYSASII
jgi:hypothetical protein